jgi:hypothetical protein
MEGVAPTTNPATSFTPRDRFGRMINDAMVMAEFEAVKELLAGLKAADVPGDVVEFGVYKGDWLWRLSFAMQDIGFSRRVYGFDSFAGLSPPDPNRDHDWWKDGDYAVAYEEVSSRFADDPQVTLVPGWFSDTLPAMHDIAAVSFARIDCDLYEPAVSCLAFLSDRLSNGAILVFDDWCYDLSRGELRAFVEWQPTVPHLRFEFLFFNSIGHFYIRVHR